MSEIDWNDNAIAAVAAYDKWLDENDGEQTASECLGNFLQTIATRPKRKTVEDAVRAVLTGFEGESLYYSPSRNTWYGSHEPTPEDTYTVCTRAEFEKAWEERYGGNEEWTHRHDGVACKVIWERDGCAWVRYQIDMDDDVVSTILLEPIKPRITKAEAWDLTLRGYKASGIAEKYDVR